MIGKAKLELIKYIEIVLKGVHIKKWKKNISYINFTITC
jgi:hypothetical protein